MSTVDYSLKNYLYRLRMYRGYSQKQFGVLVGLPPRTVSDLEKGRRLPRLVTAIRMEIALGTKLSEMYPDLYRVVGLEVANRERHLPDRFTRHIRARVLRKDSDEPVGSDGNGLQDIPPENAPPVRGGQYCLPL